MGSCMEDQTQKVFPELLLRVKLCAPPLSHLTPHRGAGSFLIFIQGRSLPERLWRCPP